MEGFYLKCQDDVLAKINADTGECELYCNESKLPLALQSCLYDTFTGKIPASKNIQQIKNENIVGFKRFLNQRALTFDRKHAKEIIHAILPSLQIKRGRFLSDKELLAVMIACRGLSVNDDFWITSSKSDQWKNFNTKENPLNNIVKAAALAGKTLPQTSQTIITPEGTTNGSQAKCWDRDNGTLYLYKASSDDDHSVDKELTSSYILSCTNVPHVDYEWTTKNGIEVTRCKNLYEETGYFVNSVIDLNTKCLLGGTNIREFIKKDPDAMIMKNNISIMSYLLDDYDMCQGKNIMVFIDPNTMQYAGIAPLIDFGDSFSEEKGRSIENYLDNETSSKFLSSEKIAKYALEELETKCGHKFCFTHQIEREMFKDDHMYMSFCKRAETLGLMRQKQLTKEEKHLLKKGEKVDLYEVNPQYFDRNDRYADAYIQNRSLKVNQIQIPTR